MDDTDRDALSKQTTIHFGSESPVTPPSTGGYPIGGPAVSRTVTISSVTGGTVTTPTRFPYPNAWVTLTVTADEGYELTDLTVTNRYGHTVPVHPLEEHVQGDLTEGEIVAVQDDQIHQFPAEGFQAAALAEDIARVFPHLGFRHRP